MAYPTTSSKDVQFDPDYPEDIFQLIAEQNGPLWDYHPILLSQCLLWDKIHLVKHILVTLVKNLRVSEEKGRRRLPFSRLDPTEFYSSTQSVRSASNKMLSRKYDSLFSAAPGDQIEEDGDLTPNLVTDLVERLDGNVYIPLSHAEKSMLATIAQATIEVERQRRSLDICGLRYLISIRMFMNLNRRAGASGTATPASGSDTTRGDIPHSSRLSLRNIVWATHSESQEVILSAATECCSNSKMLWSDAKRLGVFLWLRSSETVVRINLFQIAPSLFGTEIPARSHRPKSLHVRR